MDYKFRRLMMNEHDCPEKEVDLLVPSGDYLGTKRIYHPALFWYMLAGASLSAVMLGITAWLISTGAWPVAGLGQFSAAGPGAATFTGAGMGLALGGLTGGLISFGKIRAAST